MNTVADFNAAISRRQFFRKNGTGLGAASLATLLPGGLSGLSNSSVPSELKKVAPKAKRVIYLSMLGAPSQLDLFDYKPKLKERFKDDLSSYLKEQGQRLTGMTSGQAKFPLAPSIFEFKEHGQSGAWVSELLPHTAKMVDDIAIVKSMNTEAINHEPANQLCYTGNQQNGKPSLGSWLAYGLGSQNEDLPNFVVLHAQHTGPGNVQAISSRLWGPGFLPGKYAGVAFRPKGDPVLYLRDAPGIDRELRRNMLDSLNTLNQKSYDIVGDNEIQTRMQQYEMAFRMQASVPELSDLSSESDQTREMYGPQSKTPGSFASSCILARRMMERGVQFVQIFHRGWDQHSNLPAHIKPQCEDIDQPCWALVQDLKQRGMLDDTLVIWGGEFGRTVYSQGTLTEKNYGRDHHPRAFSMWMAGGGVKGGQVYGETDDFGYNVTENPVHISDLHTTILHQLGINHHKLTFKYQGLDQKLTGVKPTQVISEILE
ncbi:MAG: DUF1501 domain-containing protein [Akkermansiaceae bacterium]|jgi:hypothetical protein|tara:strand:- start:369 stop:1823 length:1455 start_codon:yes stop_codon:yes gene_type:complete